MEEEKEIKVNELEQPTQLVCASCGLAKLILLRLHPKEKETLLELFCDACGIISWINLSGEFRQPEKVDNNYKPGYTN